MIVTKPPPNPRESSRGLTEQSVQSVTHVTLKRYATVTEPFSNRFSIRLGFEAAANAHYRAWSQR